MLANWLYTKEVCTFHIFMTGDNFASWKEAFAEVRLLPSHRNWEVRVLSSLIIFQRGGYRFLRKTFLGDKVGKRLLSKRF